MEQDIAVKTMMLTVKHEDQIPEEYQGFIQKYLSLMWVVGFDSGRNWVYQRYSKKKTPIIVRDLYGNRIAQYESVAEASREMKICTDTIFNALKTHKKTKQDHYFEKIVL